MMFPKKVILLAGALGMIAPAWALAGSPLQAGADSPPQALRAGFDQAPIVVAYSFAEIVSFAAKTAHPATTGSRTAGLAGFSGNPEKNEAWTPFSAGTDTPVARVQRSAGPEADSGRIPAMPEPAGWVLLLSGLGIVACIAWRRASMALM